MLISERSVSVCYYSVRMTQSIIREQSDLIWQTCEFLWTREYIGNISFWHAEQNLEMVKEYAFFPKTHVALL